MEFNLIPSDLKRAEALMMELAIYSEASCGVAMLRIGDVAGIFEIADSISPEKYKKSKFGRALRCSNTAGNYAPKNHARNDVFPYTRRCSLPRGIFMFLNFLDN